MAILKKAGCYGFVRKENGEVVYVGESNNVRRRYAYHKSAWKENLENKVLYQAFHKYGRDAFEFRVFEYCETKEEALALEVKYHNIHQPKYSLRDPGLKGGRSADVRPFTLLDMETGELRSFNTKPEADRELGINSFRILNRIRRIEKGWIGKYDDDNISWQELYDLAMKINNVPKEVYQFSKDGRFIGKFENIALASKETGTNRRGLSACINGKTKTSGGYVWKLKGEE